MTWNPNEASTWSPNTQNQGPKEGLEEEIQMQKSSGWWRVAFIKEPGTLRNSVRGKVEKKTKKKKKRDKEVGETRRVWCHRSSKAACSFLFQAATDISCCQIIGHVDKSSFNDQMGAETRLEGFGSKRLSSASYETPVDGDHANDSSLPTLDQTESRLERLTHF